MNNYDSKSPLETSLCNISIKQNIVIHVCHNRRIKQLSVKTYKEKKLFLGVILNVIIGEITFL